MKSIAWGWVVFGSSRYCCLFSTLYQDAVFIAYDQMIVGHYKSIITRDSTQEIIDKITMARIEDWRKGVSCTIRNMLIQMLSVNSLPSITSVPLTMPFMVSCTSKLSFASNWLKIKWKRHFIAKIYLSKIMSEGYANYILICEHTPKHTSVTKTIHLWGYSCSLMTLSNN